MIYKLEIYFINLESDIFNLFIYYVDAMGMVRSVQSLIWLSTLN